MIWHSVANITIIHGCRKTVRERNQLEDIAPLLVLLWSYGYGCEVILPFVDPKSASQPFRLAKYNWPWKVLVETNQKSSVPKKCLLMCFPFQLLFIIAGCGNLGLTPAISRSCPTQLHALFDVSHRIRCTFFELRSRFA